MHTNKEKSQFSSLDESCDLLSYKHAARNLSKKGTQKQNMEMNFSLTTPNESLNVTGNMQA